MPVATKAIRAHRKSYVEMTKKALHALLDDAKLDPDDTFCARRWKSRLLPSATNPYVVAIARMSDNKPFYAAARCRTEKRAIEMAVRFEGWIAEWREKNGKNVNTVQ